MESSLAKYGMNSVNSSELELIVKVKIGSLEGKVKRPDFEKILEDPLLKYSGLCQKESCAELKVQVQIFADNQPISLPVSTTYKPFTTRWNWNEWISLPIRFSDLPRNAQCCLTIYDCAGPEKIIPIGGTTISLFGKNGVFRQGLIDLRVWPSQIADGNDPTLTPGKGPKGNRMYRLNKLSKKYGTSQLPKYDWLDRLTYSEIQTVCDKEKQESDFMFLNIQFPIAEYPPNQYVIVFHEKNLEDLDIIEIPSNNISKVSNTIIGGSEPKWLPDHELLLDNLVEQKHHILSRCVSDVDLKPNSTVRDQLHVIVNHPPTQQLTSDEQDLIWRFRYYLSFNKKALAKFLKCVKWAMPAEEKQALDLLEKWAPMDVQDALELLGPGFTHPTVRSYAVARLRQAPDEDLWMYLLQLVQALKYENFEQMREYLNQTTNTTTIIQHETLGPSVQQQQQQQQHQQQQQPPSVFGSIEDISRTLGESNNTTPRNTPTPSGGGGGGSCSFSNIHESKQQILESTSSVGGGIESTGLISTTSSSIGGIGDGSNTTTTTTMITTTMNNNKRQPQHDDLLSIEKPDLATFLILRACENTTLVNYFYWYLIIECEDHEVGVKQDPRIREMYMDVMKRFLNCMKKGKPEWQQRRALLSRQQKLIAKLVEVVKIVAKENANRPKKIERLQSLLNESDKMNFTKFESLPFPLDPEVMIQGIVAKESTLFKSSQMPCKLTFLTNIGQPYIAIFKHGDDLRQDQLILQIITLMDKLLRKENLDLKLTPYRVLATSTTHGFVQFIPSTTVADVLASEGTILNFFKKHSPCENEPYGVSPAVMDTYVKSCAGYCVITYLLGVGDRHLDNLLLTTDGRLFHIDFGYILGRDPKPMPPPMKLSKEMVEAMGGISTEYYQEFRKLCYTAFLHLRRHANLILNLFSLMVGASVPDIALEPDKTVKKVLDKFRLELNDEAAVKHMQELIDISVTAFMPALLEQMHKFTQMLRK